MRSPKPDSVIQAMGTQDGMLVCPFCLRPIMIGEQIVFNKVMQCRPCCQRQVDNLGTGIRLDFGPDRDYNEEAGNAAV